LFDERKPIIDAGIETRGDWYVNENFPAGKTYQGFILDEYKTLSRWQAKVLDEGNWNGKLGSVSAHRPDNQKHQRNHEKNLCHPTRTMGRNRSQPSPTR